MDPAFRADDRVQTPLGKGIVREVRNQGKLVIEIGGRVVVLDEAVVTALEDRKAGTREPEPSTRRAPPAAGPAPREIDLHGLTVEEAIAVAGQALDAALRADAAELRLIHGKRGGRIRAALHRRLREIPSVRAFHLDRRNAGVTIVSL